MSISLKQTAPADAATTASASTATTTASSAQFWSAIRPEKRFNNATSLVTAIRKNPSAWCWGISVQVGEDVRALVQLGRGDRLCVSVDPDAPAIFHPMLIIQKIAVLHVQHGIGSAFVHEILQSGICVMIQCPVTEAGRAFVRSLSCVDQQHSGEWKKCCFQTQGTKKKSHNLFNRFEF